MAFAKLIAFDRPLTGVSAPGMLRRSYSDAEIAAYIATGDPFDKAGGYAIQHAGFHPVAHIDGCYTNVVGLPLCAVKRCLETLGIYDGIAPAPDDCDCGTPFALG